MNLNLHASQVYRTNKLVRKRIELNVLSLGGFLTKSKNPIIRYTFYVFRTKFIFLYFIYQIINATAWPIWLFTVKTHATKACDDLVHPWWEKKQESLNVIARQRWAFGFGTHPTCLVGGRERERQLLPTPIQCSHLSQPITRALFFTLYF